MAEAIENVVQGIPIWRPGQIQKIEEIQGGWTNRNYKVDLDRRSYVLRLNGASTDLLGIDRQQERQITKLAAASGLSPGIAYCGETDGIMVTEYVEGKILSPAEVAQPGNLDRLAQTLREIHSLKATCAHFCPFQRATQWLQTAAQFGVQVPAKLDWIRERIQSLRDSAPAQTFPACLCHNDFVRPNILDSGRLNVVDWENAGTGNPLFDLAALSMNSQLPPESEDLLLRTYFEKGQAPHRSALVPWKRAFDFLNGAFYLVQLAVSEQGLDYERGVTHHFSRLVRDLEGD